MNKLQQAYIDLGLQPGAPLGDVVERWRRVARMWHPDRASSEDERAIAEAELKKVNGARDLIARHYEDGLHKLVGCECSAPQPAQEPPREPFQQQSAGAGSKNGAAAATPRNGKRSGKNRRRQTTPSAVASLVTIAMVLFGMFIVKMNSPVHINDSSSYGTSANAYWRGGGGGRSSVTQSTISSLRPTGAGNAMSFAENEAAAKAEVAAAEKKAAERKEREKPKPPQLPVNTSTITFVSSDGRLISLEDGTTWELWGQEAADSMFQWDKGDRVTVKGLESTPSWLVNETHGFQAVKVTSVR